MSAAVIALKLAGQLPQIDADYIGVDKGTLALIEQGLPVALAIGDFDSVTEQELRLIEEKAAEVIRLKPEKDDTDSEAALRQAMQRGYTTIYLCGRMGGRADHTLINFRLAYQNPGRVILWDEQNSIEAYNAGTYSIKKETYSYIGFFTNDEAEISIDGFKYSLTDRVLTKDDLYTVSNEWVRDTGTLTVRQGTVLVIRSKD